MKKTALVLGLAAALGLTACEGKPAAEGAASAAQTSAPSGLETEAKQLGYLMGYEMAGQLGLSALKEAGVEYDEKAFLKAINEQVEGKEFKLTPEQTEALMKSVSQKIEAHQAKKAEEAKAKAETAKVEGEKFLAENKTKEGVQTTAYGLQYKVNKEGEGDNAKKGDLVLVEYEGRLINGEVFDSSEKHGGEPLPVPVADNSGMIPGFVEAVKLMKKGGEYTVYIPANLAYGEAGTHSIPGNSVLIFDLKVKEIDRDALKSNK